MRLTPSRLVTLSELDRLRRPGADLLRNLFSRAARAFVTAGDRTSEIVDHHLGAFLGCQQRTLLADAVCAARYQNDLASSTPWDYLRSIEPARSLAAGLRP